MVQRAGGLPAWGVALLFLAVPALLASAGAGSVSIWSPDGSPEAAARFSPPDAPADAVVSARALIPAGEPFGVRASWHGDGPGLEIFDLVAAPEGVPLPPPTIVTAGYGGCLRTYGIPMTVDFPWANDPPNWRGCNFQGIHSPIHESYAFCASNGESCFIEATASHSIWFDPHRFILRCWDNGAWIADWATGEVVNDAECELSQWGDLPSVWTGYSSICATNYEATLGVSGCLHRGDLEPTLHEP